MSYIVPNNPPPLFAPHNNTPTSKAAAARIAPVAGTLRARVLEYIRSRGTDGATDSEIQAALGMDGSTERPRRIECREAGWIVDSGRTRKLPSGSEAVVWVAVDIGGGR